MKLCLCQIDTAWEDPPANFIRVQRLLERQPPEPGSLLILPEMFATGFSMDTARVAEAPAGPAAAFLAGLAGQYGCCALGGVAMRDPDGRCFNRALAYGPDGTERVRYAKLHPFTFGGERERYTPGDAVVTFDWGGMRIAPLICYDLRFPEPFRLAVRRGATLLAVMANWPAARAGHWRTLLAARAIENQAYVAGVNRCGADPALAYPGQSVVIDPQGNTVVEAGAEEAVASAALDGTEVERYRRAFPVLPDIRGDLGRD